VRGFGRRFAVEVGFIVLVAVGLAVTHLRWPAIVGLMGAAWVLTAVVEFVAWRHGRERAPEPLERPVVAPEPGATEPGSHLRVLEPPPDWPPAWELKQEPEPAREAAPVPLEPQADPEPELEPVAAAAEPELELKPVAVEAGSEPELEPVAVEAEPEPEQLQPVAVEADPEPEPELELELGLEPVAVEAEPEPKPELEPVAVEAEPEPEPVAVAREPETEPLAAEPEVVEREPTAARAWNIWELDNLARDASEEQREELSYLLVYLRDFASPEGVLPTDFDALVRESFGDLLAAGAR
jgi:hypothetical protein